VLSGISDGLGIAAYEVAGGVWDLVSKPVRRGVKEGVVGVALGAKDGVISLFARPLKGGKVMVDRIVTGATKKGQQPTSADSDLRIQTKKEEYYRVPGDIDTLSPGHLNIENAYALAVNVIEWWCLVDKDNNRCMDIRELQNCLSPKDFAEVEQLFDNIDTDDDGLLTFAEMSWVLSGTVYLDTLLSSRMSLRSVPKIRTTLTKGDNESGV
jgi:hypothetical protein